MADSKTKLVSEVLPGDRLLLEPVRVVRVEHTEAETVLHTEDGIERRFPASGEPAVETVKE